MPKVKLARKIKVGEFRQILAWPFIMPPDWGDGGPESEDRWFKKCIERLESEDSKWEEKRPRDLMQTGGSGIYEEANLFHDYIADTLFHDNPEHIRTFQRNSLRAITFKIWKKEIEAAEHFKFIVPFNSLHVYKCGVAILTLELQYSDIGFTLSDAQILAHRLRRANPPFWSISGLPEFCPQGVVIHEEVPGSKSKSLKRIDCELDDLQNREGAENALKNAKFRPLFSWWRELLAPLYVEGYQIDGSSSMLRQIMDERIPLLTTISLNGERDNSFADSQMRDSILRAVSNTDWSRIAEAAEEGIAISGVKPDIRYVNHQNIPHADDTHGTVARLIFAYHHFAAVVADSSRELNIPNQVRRLYRHMHHLCLLELATVMRISQRLYHYVKNRNLNNIKYL